MSCWFVVDASFRNAGSWGGGGACGPKPPRYSVSEMLYDGKSTDRFSQDTSPFLHPACGLAAKRESHLDKHRKIGTIRRLFQRKDAPAKAWRPQAMQVCPDTGHSESLEKLLPTLAVTGGGNVFPNRCTCDSRRVEPGDLFVAVEGTQHDGHDHVADAVARGCVAVIAQRALPDLAFPSFRFRPARGIRTPLPGTRRKSQPTIETSRCDRNERKDDHKLPDRRHLVASRPQSGRPGNAGLL